jgi:ATP-dependent RNA helicase SUPV3L1/SUV3
VNFALTPEEAALKMDLSTPADWYPQARAIPRKIYLHVGPTNSGKTYTALQAFQNSKRAFYAGPLRLLAKEVYQRMKDANKPCNLITGEEIIEELDPETNEPAQLSSGTVEMIDMNHDLDVAVIDEIQMIDDRDRGWAWTAAFLSVRAKTVHLCGDESSVNIIQKLVQQTGDELEVVRYNRLSPLVVDPTPLQEHFKDIEPGDCVVAFSKRELFQLKRAIERQGEEKKIKCAVIYGSLPAETRAEQARLFNDPTSDYNVLVASDAVGMGLNLAIKRVVFTTVRKFDGVQEARVPIAQIKQIGGRAGRYRIAGQSKTGNDEVGRVTAMSKKDLKYIRQCFEVDTPKIRRAGLFPSEAVLRQHALVMGYNTPFHSILGMLSRYSITSENYQLSDIRQMIEAARVFDGVHRLTFEDKLVLAKAPVNMKNPIVKRAFIRFCQVIANGETKNIVQIPDTGIQYLRMTNLPMGTASDTYESVHRMINLFLWLSYRFPNSLKDRKGALELRALCESKIGTVLRRH